MRAIPKPQSPTTIEPSGESSHVSKATAVRFDLDEVCDWMEKRAVEGDGLIKVALSDAERSNRFDAVEHYRRASSLLRIAEQFNEKADEERNKQHVWQGAKA